jgi:hypothetical protein
MVTLQFTPQGSKTNVYAYRIFAPPISGTNTVSTTGVNALLWPAGYYDKMVEATLSWDGSSYEQTVKGK